MALLLPIHDHCWFFIKVWDFWRIDLWTFPWQLQELRHWNAVVLIFYHNTRKVSHFFIFSFERDHCNDPHILAKSSTKKRNIGEREPWTLNKLMFYCLTTLNWTSEVMWDYNLRSLHMLTYSGCIMYVKINTVSWGSTEKWEIGLV